MNKQSHRDKPLLTLVNEILETETNYIFGKETNQMRDSVIRIGSLALLIALLTSVSYLISRNSQLKWEIEQQGRKVMGYPELQLEIKEIMEMQEKENKYTSNLVSLKD